MDFTPGFRAEFSLRSRGYLTRGFVLELYVAKELENLDLALSSRGFRQIFRERLRLDVALGFPLMESECLERRQG